MDPDLLPFLIESTVVISAALLAVLALRGPWLRLFGARNALLLWCVVPLSLFALILPAPVEHVQSSRIMPFQPATETATMERTTASAVPVQPAVTESGKRGPDQRPLRESIGDRIDAPGAAIAVWLFGLLLAAGYMGLSQWRWTRAVRPLTPMPDGSYRSALTETGPALVGALRPRIVLPADFEQRYSPEQQRLIVAHERCHLRRGDAQFNLLACVIRCLFWFHPLVHLAWPRFRVDQELACDAAVLREHPQRRREYAEAMLASECPTPQLPIGCSWLTGHSLKRRITMVYARPLGRTRLLAGLLLALAAGSVAAYGAWSKQTPQRYYTSLPMPRLQLDIDAAVPAAPVPGSDRRIELVATPLPVLPVSTAAPRLERAPASGAAEAVAADQPSPENDAPEGPANNPERLDDASSSSPLDDLVEVQHARLIEGRPPEFPDSEYQPFLVSYPGMPETLRPGPEWRPDGQLWVLLLRVTLDESGQAIDATVEDTNLADGRMVKRYEQLALGAVQQWRYAPARIDGDPVRSHVLLPFYFDTRRSHRPIENGAIQARSFNPASSQLASRLAGR